MRDQQDGAAAFVKSWNELMNNPSLAAQITGKGVPEPLLLPGHAARVNSVAYSPDGKYIVGSGKLQGVTTVFNFEKIQTAIRNKNFTGDEDGIPILKYEDIKDKLDAYKAYLGERVEQARPRWIPATVLLRALGMTTEDLLNYFYRKDTIILDGRKAAKKFIPDHLMGVKATVLAVTVLLASGVTPASAGAATAGGTVVPRIATVSGAGCGQRWPRWPRAR